MRFLSLLPIFFLSGLHVAAHPVDGTLEDRDADNYLKVVDADKFIFEYKTGSANGKNWIGIYHTTGGPDDEKQHDQALTWEWAGEKQGTVEMSIPPVRASGKYKAYFCADDGYKSLATPIEFTPESKNDHPDELWVMTYNLWHGGTKVNDYHKKQLKFLTDSGVDIIGLQETTKAEGESKGHGQRLANALGWNYHQADPADTAAIISRHPIVKRHDKTMKRSAGVAINIDSDPNKQINFWSIHTTADKYGPYEFCFNGDHDVDKSEKDSGRVQEITDVIEGTKSQREGSDPFILVGDFNAPSHKDWVDATMGRHCKVVYEWPTSMIPMEAGLIDSFREKYPDPRGKTIGNTWSPIMKYNEDYRTEEPQDRIDFIYHTDKLEVVDSEVKVAGSPNFSPDHEDNEWTSDHAAVLTKYKLK